MKESPFSVYDFLGYLIPGSFFIFGCYIIFLFETFNFLINKEFFKRLISLKDFKVDQIFLFVLVSYILGHLLSFISSITIEKYSIWTLGHPSRYLLNLDVDKAFKIEKYRIPRLICRVSCFVFLLPISILDFIFLKIFSMKKLVAKSLDVTLIEIIIGNLNKTLEKDFPLNDNGSVPIVKTEKRFDFFRIIYHYSLEKRDNHYAKIQNYIALYGFSRTITLIFISFFWLVLILDFKSGYSENKFIMLTLSLLISYLMYSNFNKLYRKFTLEVIMAAVIEK